MRGLPPEKDQIQKAADDYKRAEELYQSISPWGKSIINVARVRLSLESVNFRLHQIESDASLNMAVTRSRSVERTVTREMAAPRAAWRGREFLFLVVASLLVGAGLYQVHQAKSQGLGEVEAGLAAKRLLNLNELGAREELLPALTPFFPKSRERDAAARDIYYLTGSLSNVGGIAQRKLLTGEQFRQLKPLLVVRRPAQFQRAFYLWCGIFLGAFWLVHLCWSLRGFRGDQTVSAGAAGAERHRADPDGEPARSGARQPAVRGFRAGRGGRRACCWPC